jgi:hypothetical protein
MVTAVRFSAGAGGRFILFSSRPAVGPTRPPIEWVPGVKQPEHEADHLLPCSAEIKECVDLYRHSPYVFRTTLPVFTHTSLLWLILSVTCVSVVSKSRWAQERKDSRYLISVIFSAVGAANIVFEVN